MPDLHKLREHLLQLLPNCLPDQFSHANHTDVGVLCEGRGDRDSTIDGEGYNAVAILCLPWRGNVLLISKQHMSFTLLPFGALIVHNAEARLCWYCCLDINFILPSCLLFLHVLPFHPQPLPGVYYCPGNWRNVGFSPSCVSKAKILKPSSRFIFRDGHVRCGTYSAQVGSLLEPT